MLTPAQRRLIEIVARRAYINMQKRQQAPFVTQLPTETKIDSGRSQKADQSSRKIRTELKQK